MDLKIELAIANDQLRTKIEAEAKLRRQIEILESEAAEWEGKSWMDYLFWLNHAICDEYYFATPPKSPLAFLPLAVFVSFAGGVWWFLYAIAHSNSVVCFLPLTHVP